MLIFLAVSCTDGDRAKKALEAEGFTAIRLTGFAITECSNDDDTCTGFAAIAPSGKHVTGAVGCGYDFGGCGKGCTVRIK